jgi:hypothetical protein
MIAGILMAVLAMTVSGQGPPPGMHEGAGPFIERRASMAQEKKGPAQKPERPAQATAKAQPPAAPQKPKPAGASPGGQSDTRLVFVRLGDILLRPELYCHRMADELTAAKLEGLMESIRTERGIQVPVEVHYNADGKPELVRGYRRTTSATLLAGQEVEGFSLDMLVPAVVVSGLSAQDLLVRSVLDNENRRQPGPVERLLTARQLYEAGVPTERAASALGVKSLTYQRDLRVARRPWLVDLIKADKIAPSTAATFMEVVEKAGHEDEFKEGLLAWVERTERQIEERERQRKEEGKTLTAAQRQVKNHLTRELQARWVSDLRQGKRLDEKAAEWTLPVSLEPKKGVLQVERTRIDLSGVPDKDVAKAAARLVKMGKDLVKYIEWRQLVGESGAEGAPDDLAGLDLDFLRESGLKEVADSIAQDLAAEDDAAHEPEPAEGESSGEEGSDEGEATEGSA